MIVSDWIAVLLIIVPIGSSFVYGRLALSAVRSSRAQGRSQLQEARAVIGLVLLTISLANVWTGLGFIDQIGQHVPAAILIGAALVRTALAIGAFYLLVRRR